MYAPILLILFMIFRGRRKLHLVLIILNKFAKAFISDGSGGNPLASIARRAAAQSLFANLLHLTLNFIHKASQCFPFLKTEHLVEWLLLQWQPWFYFLTHVPLLVYQSLHICYYCISKLLQPFLLNIATDLLCSF
jgi:hypothetical protein